MSLAVITGDIVASREIDTSSRQSLYADLKTFLSLLKKEEWISNYEMFRGDSFQCVLEKKEYVLRASLLIRAFIKSYVSLEDKKKYGRHLSEGRITTKGYFPGKQDIRLSVGIGQVDFYNKNNLAHSDGEAFQISGEELDHIKKAQYRMILKTNNEDFNESIEPTILLLDAVLQKWTNNQAETVLYKLKNFKEEEIGKALKISQPAVNQRVRTSQWFAIEKSLNYFEKKLKDCK
ncbi:MAG TPA: hypothetical protein VKA92_12690 [Segetibacter sp.]|nr:hypothetical protein [Segetibacter sp.]